MEEEISSDLRNKIQKNVEKIFDKWLHKAAKSESIEGIIKNLMIEKIMNVLAVTMKRMIVRKVAKRVVRKIVDKYWEKNRENILEKIKDL